MTIHEFKGRGYVHAAAARRKLQEVESACGDCTALVAYEPTTNRYHPVVIYRDGRQLINIPWLCHQGVTVIN